MDYLLDKLVSMTNSQYRLRNILNSGEVHFDDELISLLESLLKIDEKMLDRIKSHPKIVKFCLTQCYKTLLYQKNSIYTPLIFYFFVGKKTL